MKISVVPGIKWKRITKILPSFRSTFSVPRPHFPLSNASATGHPPNLSSNTFVTPRAKLTPAGNYLSAVTKKPVCSFTCEFQQHSLINDVTYVWLPVRNQFTYVNMCVCGNQRFNIVNEIEKSERDPTLLSCGVSVRH